MTATPPDIHIFYNFCVKHQAVFICQITPGKICKTFIFLVVFYNYFLIDYLCRAMFGLPDEA